MERLPFAVSIAEEAGNLTLKWFDQPTLAVESKRDGTPVTAADRGAEELLRARIAEAFPDDAILGEEFPDRPGTSGYRWILDPIDGTKSFIHGVPFYSTLIGLEKEGEPVLGVIRLPALERAIWAEKGKGAFEQRPGIEEPIPAHVSQAADLSDACFLTSEVRTFNETGRRGLYDEMENRCRLTRTWGDAYGYYLVATGRADIMIDPEMSPWDIGPLPVIMAEAGGVFTDWTGKTTFFGGDGLAGNPQLAAQALDRTKEFPMRRVN